MSLLSCEDHVIYFNEVAIFVIGNLITVHKRSDREIVRGL